MKKDIIRFFPLVTLLCLTSCGDRIIREMMEEDFNVYLRETYSNKKRPYKIHQYLGCYNGYYSASFMPEIQTIEFVSTDPKRFGFQWCMPWVSYLNEIQFPFGSPAYFWKPGHFSLLWDVYSENVIGMGEALYVGLSKAVYDRYSFENKDIPSFLQADLSELDVAYSKRKTKEKPTFQWKVDPKTLREKICGEFANRYSFFIGSYLDSLDSEKRDSESKKAPAWIEKYLGRIGDAYVFEMGLLGLSWTLGSLFFDYDIRYYEFVRSGEVSNLWDANFISDYAFVPVLYKDGEFYSFTASFMNDIDLASVVGDYPIIIPDKPAEREVGTDLEISQEELDDWRRQTKFDDSFLDAPLP